MTIQGHKLVFNYLILLWMFFIFLQKGFNLIMVKFKLY